MENIKAIKFTETNDEWLIFDIQRKYYYLMQIVNIFIPYDM